MQPRLSLSIFPVLAILAACGDDVATDPTGTACTITERVRLAAPPEGWVYQADDDYTLYRFPDFVLYSFDDRDDPARRFWRLDPCTGETTPFPSLAPGLGNVFLVDTEVGRVLYASDVVNDYYVVDRVDEPGDDEPRRIADLPRPGWLDFTSLWNAQDVPYGLFFRDGDLYTHTGGSAAPAVRIASDTRGSFPFREDVLVADSTGDLRLVDPFTGASDVLLAGSQRTALVDWGVALDDMRVLWQPVGESALYLRRLGEGTDLVLDVDPALIDSEAAVEPWWRSPDGLVLTLTDPLRTRISAAVRTDTGAAIVVPQHVDHDYLEGNALGLSLADGDVRVEAIWEPATGALREWYRGPAPVPYLHAVDGDHADYIVPDSTLPDERALWRVDLDSGERRLLLARMGSVMSVVDTDKYVMKFNLPASEGTSALFDIDYVDITTAEHILIAGSVSKAVEVPGEGVLYLDALGAEPGVWVAPLP